MGRLVSLYDRVRAIDTAERLCRPAVYQVGDDHVRALRAALDLLDYNPNAFSDAMALDVRADVLAHMLARRFGFELPPGSS